MGQGDGWSSSARSSQQLGLEQARQPGKVALRLGFLDVGRPRLGRGQQRGVSRWGGQVFHDATGGGAPHGQRTPLSNG